MKCLSSTWRASAHIERYASLIAVFGFFQSMCSRYVLEAQRIKRDTKQKN